MVSKEETTTLNRAERDKEMNELAEIKVMKKDLVDSLLKMNTNNRSIRHKVVERYARDIKNGNWKFTNQGIGVSKDGVLVDGQHRLLALKECNYPEIKMVIVYGLDEDSQRVVDQNAKRSARDMFRILQNTQVSRNAPAIMSVFARCEESCPMYLKQSTVLTMEEMFNLFEHYGESIETVCELVGSDKFFSAPVLAAFTIFIHKKLISTERLKIFADRIKHGESLTKDMPEYHLRNYLVVSRNGSSGGTTQQQERYIKTCKALDAFVENKPMKRLAA